MATNKASKQEAAQEESMEDILHSIKDIISGKPVSAPEQPQSASNDSVAEENPEAAKAPQDDVLELTEVVGEPSALDAPADFSDIQEKQPSTSDDVIDNIDNLLGNGTNGNAMNTDPFQNSAPDTDSDKALDDAMAALQQEESAAASMPSASSLLSNDQAQATSDALGNLMNAIPKPHVNPLTLRDGVTLEGLIIETMKPMLADWLNKNMAVIVREIVEKEIRKLVPKE